MFVDESTEIVVVTVYTTTFDPGAISYDAEVDALSITFRETTVTTKRPVQGIAADYNSDRGLRRAKTLRQTETMRRAGLEGVGT